MNKLTYILRLLTLLLFIPLSGYAQTAQKKPAAVPYGNNTQKGHYFATGGIKLYYEIYGKGEPLLLIHGNGGTIRDWRFQIPYFSKYYKVIAVDSRSQGKSVDTSGVLHYTQMADDFAALLTHLKIDSAYVVGWSDGGINGLLLAIRHPEKVKKMAITGANLRPDSTAVNQDGAAMITAEISRLRALQQDAPTKNTIKLLHMMEVEPNIPLTDLHKISCPVLVMGGDFDVIKPAHTLEIFQHIPKAHLWILPGAGHGTPHRFKTDFNQNIRHFFTHSYQKPGWMDWEP
ncbi:MAG: alpha/beta hydrolase [Saprospiraceae bacterium]|nr:alpha/beta hydrolase [Saprospiraceae bacterium]